MMDLLMIVLLVVAFVAAFGYARTCSRLVNAGNATEDQSR
jgi:hypothetical protein